MKKILSVLVVTCICFLLVFALSACDENSYEDVNKDYDVPLTSSQNTTGKKEETPEPDVPDTTTSKVNSFEEVEEALSNDVESTIDALASEWEELSEEIDTYEQYSKNTDKVEAFYKKVLSETESLCNRLCLYTLNYAQIILSSGKSCDDMYDDFSEVYDNVYDDAGDEIYDEIYDGIFDDMYDAFYDGVIDDAYDTLSYSEWSKVHSNEYKWWSGARSEVYEVWSDTRSDIYDFYSDMRSDLWGEDLEDARGRMSDFEEDVNKMLGIDASTNENKPVNTTKAPVTTSKPANSISPEFKAAMDSYEAFFDEYCAFMKKYKESTNPLGMMSDYLDFMSRYADAMNKLNEIGDEELNNAELLYYTEVMLRINQKILEAAQ